MGPEQTPSRGPRPDTMQSAMDKLEFEKVRARVMHYASSEPGRSVLTGLTVSTSLSRIREELARVSEMKLLLVQEEGLPLDGIHPVRPALQRSFLEGAVLQPRELLQIASLLHASRTVRAFVARRKEQYPLLWEQAEALVADKILEFNIDQAIDETEAVRASASKELRSIRRAIADRYEGLRKKLEGILRQVSGLGFSQDEIITTREGRMVIPVKSEFKNQVPGFMHSASSSGATVFIEPAETLDLNNEIRSLQFQEQREVERILRALTVQVAGAKDAILLSLDLLAAIDGVHARAKYSIEILGREPVVAADGPLRLVQSRHPILLMKHGYDGTMPLDLVLGEAYHTLVISGPNAGGKSVAMKTVGLLALMAQAGLHISAAEGTRLRIFRNVLVDIGDDQSIENDLSTFSSHLKNLRSIAEAADDGTLVLIDEIGSGTDPAEGGALAAALLEYLTRKGACTIATTHHGALKAFAYDTPGVENGAMEFDQATLTPTYRFTGGVPGSSYALEMASRLGFSEPLLERARAVLGLQQTRLGNLITELEAGAQQNRKELAELRGEKQRVDELMQKYEAKISAQSAELKEMRRKAVDEANRIVERANAVIENSVREIREHGAEKETLQRVRRAVETVREEVASEEADLAPVPPEPGRPVEPGSHVRMGPGSDAGEVISLSADGKSAVVLFGQVKMRVPVKDLEAVDSPAPSLRPVYAPPSELSRTAARELDLRGMTGEEALPLVDKFIDDAVLAGLHRVDIIHGKGTGALRKKVTEFLSGHPRVRGHHLAEWNEGGTGATVVELGDQ